MKDHSDGLGYKKLSAFPLPRGRQMGRRRQRTITDLTLDSKLRNMIEKDSEAPLDMSREMRWQKHNNVSSSIQQNLTEHLLSFAELVCSGRATVPRHGKSVSH